MLWRQILRLGSKEIVLNQVKNIFASQTQILLPKRMFPSLATQGQGSRLTFQLSGQVASERFDFTSQNKFLLARLFCLISYCVQRLKVLTRGIQRIHNNTIDLICR